MLVNGLELTASFDNKGVYHRVRERQQGDETVSTNNLDDPPGSLHYNQTLTNSGDC